MRTIGNRADEDDIELDEQEVVSDLHELGEDEFDEFDDENRRRAEIIRRARVEGIEVAYESALAVCRDAKAPAQAKASAQRTLMQIGGLLDKAERELQNQKPLHEWTPEEIADGMARLKRDLARTNRLERRRSAARGRPAKGVFG